MNQSGSNATLITGGYYNVTVVAGLNNQGPWYMATIPSIQLNPNSTIYVTVSVPSGVVTIITSNEGSSAVNNDYDTARRPQSTTDNQYVCGVGLWLFKLTPVQNASLYLKLVTSQGVTITSNGTVFVFHTAPDGDGYYGGSGQYCVALNGNATGYAGLTSNDGLAADRLVWADPIRRIRPGACIPGDDSSIRSRHIQPLMSPLSSPPAK